MSTTNKVFSQFQINLIIYVLLATLPIIGMAVDLVAPSLPAIAKSLDQPSSSVQNIISLYIIGYGSGNFFGGILTDALGRRKILITGLAIFILVSLASAVTSSIIVLLVSRLIQGITLGAFAVTVRAVLSDILPAQKLVGMGVILGMMWGIGPIIGPIIGSYLQFYYGWQYEFYFFALLGIIGLVAVFYLVPETIKSYSPLKLNILKNNMKLILSHRQFLGLAILMGFTYALIISFNTIGPFIIQNYFHYSAIQFGKLALWLGVVYLIATILCRYSLKHILAKNLLKAGVLLSFLIVSIALIAGYYFHYNVTIIVLVSAAMFSTCGFIFPLSMGKGMSLFNNIAGNASATMYLINMSVTSICSALLSLANIQTSLGLVITYASISVISLIIYGAMIHPRN